MSVSWPNILDAPAFLICMPQLKLSHFHSCVCYRATITLPAALIVLRCAYCQAFACITKLSHPQNTICTTQGIAWQDQAAAVAWAHLRKAVTSKREVTAVPGEHASSCPDRLSPFSQNKCAPGLCSCWVVHCNQSTHTVVVSTIHCCGWVWCDMFSRVMNITVWCVAFREHTQNGDGLITTLRVMSQAI